jgi:hypothetical protein
MLAVGTRSGVALGKRSASLAPATPSSNNAGFDGRAVGVSSSALPPAGYASTDLLPPQSRALGGKCPSAHSPALGAWVGHCMGSGTWCCLCVSISQHRVVWVQCCASFQSPLVGVSRSLAACGEGGNSCLVLLLGGMGALRYSSRGQQRLSAPTVRVLLSGIFCNHGPL